MHTDPDPIATRALARAGQGSRRCHRSIHRCGGEEEGGSGEGEEIQEEVKSEVPYMGGKTEKSEGGDEGLEAFSSKVRAHASRVRDSQRSIRRSTTDLSRGHTRTSNPTWSPIGCNLSTRQRLNSRAT